MYLLINQDSFKACLRESDWRELMADLVTGEMEGSKSPTLLSNKPLVRVLRQI